MPSFSTFQYSLLLQALLSLASILLYPDSSRAGKQGEKLTHLREIQEPVSGIHQQLNYFLLGMCYMAHIFPGTFIGIIILILHIGKLNEGLVWTWGQKRNWKWLPGFILFPWCQHRVVTSLPPIKACGSRRSRFGVVREVICLDVYSTDIYWALSICLSLFKLLRY